jgi:hypothetical protein
MPTGRLGDMTQSPSTIARVEIAIASVLEAFAWLPSGSFPMAADSVFSFAAQHIQNAIENEVTCSILSKLVAPEDYILDIKALARARTEGQVGNTEDIEETIVYLTAEVCYHAERESVLHLYTESAFGSIEDVIPFRGSRILGMYAGEGREHKAPTPLHEVGTWRRPIVPSYSAKVRLVDAAIQAFSATFGLKSGKEQQGAMDMLESLIPPFLALLAKAIGVNAALAEQDRRVKVSGHNNRYKNPFGKNILTRYYVFRRKTMQP